MIVPRSLFLLIAVQFCIGCASINKTTLAPFNKPTDHELSEAEANHIYRKHRIEEVGYYKFEIEGSWHGGKPLREYFKQSGYPRWKEYRESVSYYFWAIPVGLGMMGLAMLSPHFVTAGAILIGIALPGPYIDSFVIKKRFNRYLRQELNLPDDTK